MSTQAYSPKAPEMPGISSLLQIKNLDATILERVERERRRLMAESGLAPAATAQFTKPVERAFTREERDRTTILFGGLTWKHEKLIQGVLESLGYRCGPLPTPDVRSYQLGREYGNNGQCNPTYFTVGNLVQYLQALEKQGLTRKQIIDNYVFFTAGACGPCRFGMYEAEYRLALRNSGFEGFRVLLFQQNGGLNQADVEAGLEMNLDFFLGILTAMNIGDVINDVAYQIRPYEVNKGETDRVLEECMNELGEVMRRHKPFDLRERSPLLARFLGSGGQLGKLLHQIASDNFTTALKRVRDRLDAIPVDRTRVKPVVKITGEFWAQTTEGDGNFNMFAFLQREGAEVVVEPIATWIMYMIHQHKQHLRDRNGIPAGQAAPPAWRIDERIRLSWATREKLARMTLAEKAFSREYNRIRDALGRTTHALVSQYELQRIGHPYYNSRSAGGEGHLEVAKNIYYHNKNLAHMVLSLKPFGCMPSTQSDGVQSAVLSHFRDMIFLPIETSGEGEINAHSRVQMALGEAKAKAKLEYQSVLDSTGYSVDQIRAFVETQPRLQRAIIELPHYEGVIGTAARFVRYASELMMRERVPARSVARREPALAAR